MINRRAIPAYVLLAEAREASYTCAAALGLILYGSTAYQRYVPEFMNLNPNDLDFLVPSSTFEAFLETLAEFERNVAVMTMSACPTANVAVSHTMSFHQIASGIVLTTANLFVNGKSFADLTIDTPASKFPRSEVMVEGKLSTYALKILSIDELLMRMAQTVKFQPPLDLENRIMAERTVRRCNRDRVTLDGAMFLQSVGKLLRAPSPIILHPELVLPHARGIRMLTHADGECYASLAPVPCNLTLTSIKGVLLPPKPRCNLTLTSIKGVLLPPKPRCSLTLVRLPGVSIAPKSVTRRIMASARVLRKDLLAVKSAFLAASAEMMQGLAKVTRGMLAKNHLLSKAAKTIATLEGQAFRQHYTAVQQDKKTADMLLLVHTMIVGMYRSTFGDRKASEDAFRHFLQSVAKEEVPMFSAPEDGDTVDDMVKKQIQHGFFMAMDVALGNMDEKEHMAYVRGVPPGGYSVFLTHRMEAGSGVDAKRCMFMAALATSVYTACTTPMLQRMHSIDTCALKVAMEMDRFVAAFNGYRVKERMCTDIVRETTMVRKACLQAATM